MAQTFILGVPPKVAANWFGVNERTTATSIGALFNQLGVAVGFLMSPSIVQQPDDVPKLFLIQAIICSTVAPAVMVGFREHPPSPPSVTAASTKTPFHLALSSLIQNRSFVIIFFSFGIGVGSFYALSTLLDEIVAPFGYSEVTFSLSDKMVPLVQTLLSIVS